MSGISTQLRDAPTILRVMVTNKCNMTCSFCSAIPQMFTDDKRTPDTDADVQLEEMIEVLKTTPSITNIVWAGGEPLIGWIRMERMVKAALRVRPDVTHELVTNGHYLKKHMIPVLEKFYKITVSFDGYKKSERPLWELVKHKRLEPFEVMRSMTNIRSWAVLTRDQLADMRWYEDLIELHQELYALNVQGISVIFDNGMKKPLSPDHVLNFIYGWKQLQANAIKMNNTNPNRACPLSVDKIFDMENCNRCSESVMLKADGGTEQRDNCNVVTTAGCNQLASVIGVDAYEYLNKFLKRG